MWRPVLAGPWHADDSECYTEISWIWTRFLAVPVGLLDVRIGGGGFSLRIVPIDVGGRDIACILGNYRKTIESQVLYTGMARNLKLIHSNVCA